MKHHPHEPPPHPHGWFPEPGKFAWFYPWPREEQLLDIHAFFGKSTYRIPVEIVSEENCAVVAVSLWLSDYKVYGNAARFYPMSPLEALAASANQQDPTPPVTT